MFQLGTTGNERVQYKFREIHHFKSESVFTFLTNTFPTLACTLHRRRHKAVADSVTL